MPRVIATATSGLGLTLASTFAGSIGLTHVEEAIGFGLGILLLIVGAWLFVAQRHGAEEPEEPFRTGIVSRGSEWRGSTLDVQNQGVSIKSDDSDFKDTDIKIS